MSVKLHRPPRPTNCALLPGASRHIALLVLLTGTLLPQNLVTLRPPPAATGTAAHPPAATPPYPALVDTASAAVRPAIAAPAPPAIDAERTRATLARLADTCTFWQREVAAGRSGSAMRDDACLRMQQFAAEYRLTAPASSAPAPSRSQATAQRDEHVQIAVDDCRAFGSGSIAFRECRHRERARLDDWCRQLRQRSDRLDGEARQTALALREAVCSAADRYLVMR